MVHVSVTHSMSAVRVVFFCFLALLLLSCGAQNEPQQLGEQGSLRLPLQTTINGVTLRLHGTFSISPWEPEDAPPLSAVSADTDPTASEIRTTLPVGEYAVTLQPGWRLEQLIGGTWLTLPATLASTPRQYARIQASLSSSITYHFTGYVPSQSRGGELVVGIDYTEAPFCGNGRVEDGEACDDGPLNGYARRCDGGCQSVCENACPIRVHPNAEPGGSGRNWDDAMASIQGAIDVQAALGGGEVWVARGDFEIPPLSATKLFELRSNVKVFGGFIGLESTAAERDPTQYTRLRDPRQPLELSYEAARTDGAITAVAATAALVENVQIESRFRPFSIKSGSSVVLRRFSAGWIYNQEIYSGEVRNAELRLEHAALTSSGLVASDARVAVVDAVFSGYPRDSIGVSRTMLSLERVDTVNWVALNEESRLFALSSTFRGNAERGGVISGLGGGGAVTLVDSAVVPRTSSWTPVRADDLFVFNSSFIEISAGPAGGSYPEGSGVQGVDVEVAASTFYDNSCTAQGFPCNRDVLASGSSLVHNTFFTVKLPPPSGPPGPPTLPEVDPATGNCYAFEDYEFDVFKQSGWAVPKVHPCPDGGNVEQLEGARLRLLERAQPFQAIPFLLDVSAYEDPNWYRPKTSRGDACEDQDAPDPGRHYSCPRPITDEVIGCSFESYWPQLPAFSWLALPPEDAILGVAATAVDARGGTVVGTVTVGSQEASTTRRIIWRNTYEPGTVLLDHIVDPPPGLEYEDVVSCDGSTAVFSDGPSPVRWTEQGLTPVAAETEGWGVTAMSADGSVLVGDQGSEWLPQPVMWRNGELSTLPLRGGARVFGLSADGTDVFAAAEGCSFPDHCVFKWSEAAGETGISFQGGTQAASSDGRSVAVVVGLSFLSVWRDGVATEASETCPGNYCLVQAISSRGSVVLLRDSSVDSWVYSQKHGFRSLRSLINRYGDIIGPEWKIFANDMSDDARVFVGAAWSNWGGPPRAFHLTLPHSVWE